MPRLSDPLIPNAGALTGNESIPIGNGTNAALVTTPEDLKTYIAADPANAAIQVHISAAGNPHGTTAADVGADPAGTAAAAVAALVGSTPETLDTLKELADALGDDPNFAATTAAAIGNKIDKSLATAANQFLVSSGIGAFVTKTVDEIKNILGLGNAAYKDVGTTAGTVLAGDTEIPVITGLLTKVSAISPAPNATYAIQASDLGKEVRFTCATAVTLTFPASPFSGFADGFQCTLHNDSANAIDVSFSGVGVLKSPGTKLGQYKSCLVRFDGSYWRVSGGVS